MTRCSTSGAALLLPLAELALYDLEPILKALHDENKIFYRDGAVSLNKCA